MMSPNQTPERKHFGLLRVRTAAASDFYKEHGFQRAASNAQVAHVLELTNAA